MARLRAAAATARRHPTNGLKTRGRPCSMRPALAIQAPQLFEELVTNQRNLASRQLSNHMVLPGCGNELDRDIDTS